MGWELQSKMIGPRGARREVFDVYDERECVVASDVVASAAPLVAQAPTLKAERDEALAALREFHAAWYAMTEQPFNERMRDALILAGDVIRKAEGR